MKKNMLTGNFVVSHCMWLTLLCLCMLVCFQPGQQAKASIITDTIDLILPTPAVGQKAAEVQATTATAGTVVIASEWHRVVDDETFVLLTGGDTFTKGTYFCRVRVEPTTGYKFASSPVATINGAGLGGYALRAEQRIVVKSLDFKVGSSTNEVGTVQVQLPTPVIGQQASAVKATTSTTGAVVSASKWFRQTGSSYSAVAADHVFATGTYYCEISIGAASGYVFTASAQATINGAAPDGYGLVGTTKIVPLSKDFVLKPIMQEVGEVRIVLPTPLIGQQASEVKATTSTVGVVLAEAKWYILNGRSASVVASDHVFAAGTYYCEVSIDRASGYIFPDFLQTSFNGGETESHLTRGGGVIKAKSPTFTISSLVPTSIEIDRIDVNLPEPVAGQTPKGSAPSSSTKGLVVGHVWHRKADGAGQPMLLDEKFTEGETYYCYVILTVDNGYLLGSSAKVYLNNIEAPFTVAPHRMFVQGNSKDYALQDTSITAPGANQLLSVTTPKAITGVSNGTAKSVAGLKLPSTVTLVTYDGDLAANVTWDVEACSYDMNMTEAQTFMIQGAVTLPSGIDNEKNVLLTVSISVSVDALASFSVEFTVRYHANSGTGTPPVATTVHDGDLYTTASNMFNRSGYEFTGWGTSTHGGTLYAPGASFKVEENVMLYAQWSQESSVSSDVLSKPVDLPPSSKTESSTDMPNEITTVVFTIDSKTVTKNGIALPELDVPAMIINGRTMIPFRYFIETALGGTANFDASTYTITATVRDHTFVMVIDDNTIYVDGIAEVLSQAPTIVDSRTLVPLRLVETIAKSVGWDSLTRKATIIL